MTYDELRVIAIQAVTFPSLEAEGALAVLDDALQTYGVHYVHGNETPGWVRNWTMRWAMKAVYGQENVTAPWHGSQVWLEPGFDKSNHRKWSTERLEAHQAGEPLVGPSTWSS